MQQYSDEDQKNYSCGPSPRKGELFEKEFKDLPKPDQQERMLYLWKIAFQKAKGAAYILQKQIYQNNKIFIEGFNSK